MIIITVLFCIYFFLMILLILGWNRAELDGVSLMVSAIPVSVLVPFRNEGTALPALLNSLKNQDYGLLEIILIDDHSTDDSWIKIESFIKENKSSNIRIVKSAGHGKKTALTTGIHSATGKIIITTDADCIAGSHWVATMVQYFFTESTNMVLGPVRIQHDKTFWSAVQQFEFASLIGTSAATMGFKIPSMCNGANLAFRKSVFVDVGGYSSNMDIPSGDDEFLMRKFAALGKESVRYNYDKRSIVTTQPLTTVSNFIQQRIRWAGKWKHLTDLKTKILAVLIFSFHLSVYALFVYGLINPIIDVTLVTLLSIKATLELVFLKRVSAWLGNKWSWKAFLFWQLVYPTYSTYVGMASLMVGYKWKERYYQPLTEL